ncbi:helix-turn-helix domain-containing protein [Paenibacillus oenotherae]|uniref:Helix-turn-helix domain-containing protein n=1 Tax=Paenibacillus oenotherae TaxID=1435645 RepID=A0ABS7D323_9BACL|nr:helix-turn-helix domain-containing protein [Paenibacillus oenotherae]MBW7474325.1 helix-turn-helix domain-containing protein [Paenibacillus oenotherae]
MEDESLESRDKEIVEFKNIDRILRRRISLVQFIADALEGKIFACVVNSKENGLNQFSFFKEDVEQFISNGTIPIDEAARQLNVTKQSLRGWIKMGLIKQNTNNRFYSLNLEEIKKFKYHYIPLTELLKLHPHINNVSSLFSYLTNKDIYPVTALRKDRCVANLYKKDQKLLRAMGLESWN